MSEPLTGPASSVKLINLFWFLTLIVICHGAGLGSALQTFFRKPSSEVAVLYWDMPALLGPKCYPKQHFLFEHWAQSNWFSVLPTPSGSNCLFINSTGLVNLKVLDLCIDARYLLLGNPVQVIFDFLPVVLTWIVYHSTMVWAFCKQLCPDWEKASCVSWSLFIQSLSA